jgi:hypothetical protein
MNSSQRHHNAEYFLLVLRCYLNNQTIQSCEVRIVFKRRETNLYGYPHAASSQEKLRTVIRNLSEKVEILESKVDVQENNKKRKLADVALESNDNMMEDYEERDDYISQNPSQNEPTKNIPHLNQICPSNSHEMNYLGDRRLILYGRDLQGNDIRVKFDRLEIPMKPIPNRSDSRTCYIPYLEKIYPNATLCNRDITVNVCVKRQNGLQSNCLPFTYVQGINVICFAVNIV